MIKTAKYGMINPLNAGGFIKIVLAGIRKIPKFAGHFNNRLNLLSDK